MQTGDGNATVVVEPNDHSTASRVEPDVIRGGNRIPRPARRHDRERLKRRYSEMLADISYHEVRLSKRRRSGKQLRIARSGEGGPPLSHWLRGMFLRSHTLQAQIDPIREPRPTGVPSRMGPSRSPKNRPRRDLLHIRFTN